MAQEVVTPQYILSLPLQGLAALLAASTRFQTEVDAVDADAAMDSIHFPYSDDRDDDNDGVMNAPRPRAIMNPGPGFKFSNKGAQSWNATGNLYLCFEFLPDPEHTKRDDQLLDFMNKAGQIIEQMAEFSARNLLDGSATYLNMADATLVDGPAEANFDNETQLFYGVIFLIDWVG
jgi:hypothetical protein